MSLPKDTFFYSLAHWGGRLIGFVVTPITIAYFTPADYGYMSLVNTLAFFGSILVLLGLFDQGLPRFFIDSQNELEKKAYVSTSILTSSVSLCIILLLIFLSSPIIPLFFNDVDVPSVFISLIALICLAQSLQYVGRSMLKWTFQSSLYAKIDLVQAFIGAGVTIGGIVLLGWRAKEVLLTAFLVSLCAGLWANYSVKGYFKATTISKKKLRELAVFTWPLLGLNIFAFFTRSLDRIILANLTSLSEVGIFSVSYAVANLFVTLVSGFLYAWGPYILSTFRETWAPRQYSQFFSAVSCFGIINIVVLGLWGSPIVMLFRPDGVYEEIGVLIPWIVTGSLLYFLGTYFSPGPEFAKKSYWKLIGFVLAGLCNAVLNYSLIPMLGLLGAGIATTSSSLIAGIFLQVVSNRLYYITHRWPSTFAIIILFTTFVSLFQNEQFIYNINEISFISRLLLTILLIVLGSLPFYKDIKGTGVFQEAARMLIK